MPFKPKKPNSARPGARPSAGRRDGSAGRPARSFRKDAKGGGEGRPPREHAEGRDDRAPYRGREDSGGRPPFRRDGAPSEGRPPRRFDGPPRRFDGPPRDRDDRPLHGGRPSGPPRRFDGPPRERDDRPRHDERPSGPPRRFDGPPRDRDDRPRYGERPSGPPRRFDGPPPRRFDGPPRDRDDRPRHGERPSGPPRRFDGPPPRRFDGPPPRRFDGPPPRRFDGPPRHERDGDSRPPRNFDGPPRRFDGPPRNFDGPPRRFDGPPRQHDGPPRRFDGPPRRFDGPPRQHDGPPRRFDGPPQHSGERPRFDGPQRSAPKNQLPEALIYGINPVSVALEHGRLRRLFVDRDSPNPRVHDIMESAEAEGVEVASLESQGWGDALSRDMHQGVAGLLSGRRFLHLEQLVTDDLEESTILFLDKIQDPHNLGAVLRTAAATGVTAVVLPKSGGCGLTPAVHKASAGMSLIVNVVEDVNFAQALDMLKSKGYWVVGCDSGGGEDATAFEFPKRRVLVMGSEGTGIRRLVKERCDHLVKLPMATGVESLNISVATGVILYLANASVLRSAAAAAEGGAMDAPAAEMEADSGAEAELD